MQKNSNIEIDFRSDTVTRPTDKMREAMASAEVGDDYYRDDPTVRALEDYTARLFEKESALFTPSGTQSNLIAVMSHCAQGEAYIVGDQSHSYLRELGGAAVVASVQPQVIPNQSDGTLAVTDIEAALYPASILFSPARMIALENTFNGQILPIDYLQQVSALARQRSLRMHLDGARIFNAARALNVHVCEIAQHFDTISFCLSKGLGAPVGSLLVGTRDTIEKGRRHRQLLGGGLRQAGILAAAGLYALNNHIERLTEDHKRAKRLAKALADIPGVTPDIPQTNMVFCAVNPAVQDHFAAFLLDRQIAVSGTASRQRWVTHLDIGEATLTRTLDHLTEFAKQTVAA